MSNEKLYDVIFKHVDKKTGVLLNSGYNDGLKMNATPMVHSEACHFKWAIDMNRKGSAYILVERGYTTSYSLLARAFEKLRVEG